jgi:hypothetical protein
MWIGKRKYTRSIGILRFTLENNVKMDLKIYDVKRRTGFTHMQHKKRHIDVSTVMNLLARTP